MSQADSREARNTTVRASGKETAENAISRLKNVFLSDLHAIQASVASLVVRAFLTNLFSISNQPHEPRVVNRIRGRQPILILAN